MKRAFPLARGWVLLIMVCGGIGASIASHRLAEPWGMLVALILFLGLPALGVLCGIPMLSSLALMIIFAATTEGVQVGRMFLTWGGGLLGGLIGFVIGHVIAVLPLVGTHLFLQAGSSESPHSDQNP